MQWNKDNSNHLKNKNILSLTNTFSVIFWSILLKIMNKLPRCRYTFFQDCSELFYICFLQFLCHSVCLFRCFFLGVIPSVCATVCPSVSSPVCLSICLASLICLSTLFYLFLFLFSCVFLFFSHSPISPVSWFWPSKNAILVELRILTFDVTFPSWISSNPYWSKQRFIKRILIGPVGDREETSPFRENNVNEKAVWPHENYFCIAPPT